LGLSHVSRLSHLSREVSVAGGAALGAWRPRKGGGRAIWRCEEHRDNWPNYAEEFPLQEAAR